MDIDDIDQTAQDVCPAPADTQRRKLNPTERLAATILQLKRADPLTGLMIPIIDWQWSRTKTPKEIVATFERWHRWDHFAALELGGTNHPSNVEPLPRLEHEAVKTPQDIKKIAKKRRITAAQAECRKAMLRPNPQPEPAKRSKPKAKIPSRPMNGTRASNWKHRMDGTWERRPRRDA